MFQLVSVNCHSITTELHEESGFTFSLINLNLKQAVRSPPFAFSRLSNSALSASSQWGWPWRPSGNPGRFF